MEGHTRVGTLLGQLSITSLSLLILIKFIMRKQKNVLNKLSEITVFNNTYRVLAVFYKLNIGAVR